VDKIILIIEDEFDIQTMLSTALQRAGYKTVVRGDGASGLKWLEQIAPELVILDIMLPELDGVELLARLRETPNGEHVPVIVSSASIQHNESDFSDYNISKFLPKPVMPKQMVEHVASIIGVAE